VTATAAGAAEATAEAGDSR